MRKILFRAKRLDNGEWVVGYVMIHDYNKATIFRQNQVDGSLEGFEVDPETVCQYTGMIDSNGNKIWEYDLIKFEDTGEDGYEYKEGYEFINIAMVCFSDGRWELDNFAEDEGSMKETMEDGYHSEFIGVFRSSEVIGNIFDNPELMEGGAE